VFRDEAQDRCIGSQHGKNGRQHEKGIQNRHDAYHLGAIEAGDDDAGRHPQTCCQNTGGQGPGRACKDFRKSFVRDEIVDFAFDETDHYL
jgi:hypothetical protein